MEKYTDKWHYRGMASRKKMDYFKTCSQPG